jgi:hypothetical protein
LGLAAGAVVGGAIAASQPWYGYGGYGSGYSGYPGYAASYYTSGNGYDYGAHAYNYGSGSYTDHPAVTATYHAGSDAIISDGRCWVNTTNGNYNWVNCQ